MDIPNLSPTSPPPVKKNFLPYLLIALLAVGAGFGLSRLTPTKTGQTSSLPSGQEVIPIESITDKESLVVGKIYGNASAVFKDSATGTIEKGGINGEGTHTLNRPGGASQRAALTSSVLDLDLFVGRQVEVRGETNSSTKAGWLMDVGSIKLIE